MALLFSAGTGANRFLPALDEPFADRLGGALLIGGIAFGPPFPELAPFGLRLLGIVPAFRAIFILLDRLGPAVAAAVVVVTSRECGGGDSSEQD